MVFSVKSFFYQPGGHWLTKVPRCPFSGLKETSYNSFVSSLTTQFILQLNGAGLNIISDKQFNWPHSARAQI